MRQQSLDEEVLQTALCEVMAVLNDRPITTVSEDSKDPQALTPNHLLQIKGIPVQPPSLFQKDDIPPTNAKEAEVEQNQIKS